jgi:hypothetical protein
MASRNLLYLDARAMAAWRWRRGALSCEAEFTPDEEGLERFADHLAENPKQSFALLVNVAEEGFHVETIPYLRGGDRETVIRRKLAQTFFDTPLCAAISLGREKGRRRDERLLLAALSAPSFFQPWLDAMGRANAALSGIFSLPLLAPALLRKLRLPPEPCLLLSIQDQSLRQSFFEKGEARFSRLTPLQDGDPGEIVATEAARISQYLSSQRLIGRGQAITAHVLAQPRAFDAIRERCVDTPALRFHVLDPVECARRIGLASCPPDRRVESLFLHLLATDPPGVQFADATLRHDFCILRLGSWLRGAGVAALAACLLLSGAYLFDARQNRREAADEREVAALSRRHYEAVVETFPRLPVDHETLKRVIERYLAEEVRGATPLPLYREISRALQGEAAVDIDRLEWKIDGAGEGIVVHGRLHAGAQATTRQTLAAFGRFVDLLRANAALKVDVLRQPFDIAPDLALRGGDTREEAEKPRGFVLRLARRSEP